MVLAAIRIFSSRPSRFFSWESAAPISLSCSSRRKSSSFEFTGPLNEGRYPPRQIRRREADSRLRMASLDADRADLGDVGSSLQYLLDPVHLERAHALLECDGHHLRHPGMLLNQLLHG